VVARLRHCASNGAPHDDDRRSLIESPLHTFALGHYPVDMIPPPLALYVHLPWCVRKCPYCDFNSHRAPDALPIADYVRALLADLDRDLADYPELRARRIETVFFGGGTPSLFPPEAIGAILDGASARVGFADDAEITLEANPGTTEHARFAGYRAVGINRISLGVQSFDDAMLQRLGRIHGSDEARRAAWEVLDAGFTELNLDLMYALPEQTTADALADIETAIALAPTHISHYQLTLEPHTEFAAHPPPLPDDDDAFEMMVACQARLTDAGYAQYETSAYARAGHRCRHNLNYWTFGDYLGIGAGAHGKLTVGNAVRRRWKHKHPRLWLAEAGSPAVIGGDDALDADILPFEFAMNALRLNGGFEPHDFAARTGLDPKILAPALARARVRDLIECDDDRIRASAFGRRFLNDLLTEFLPDGR
jgi:oxygen-independent coproporphyrinogen-3 oxidase